MLENPICDFKFTDFIRIGRHVHSMNYDYCPIRTSSELNVYMFH
jgi:hypothetical protein